MKPEVYCCSEPSNGPGVISVSVYTPNIINTDAEQRNPAGQRAPLCSAGSTQTGANVRCLVLKHKFTKKVPAGVGQM